MVPEVGMLVLLRPLCVGAAVELRSTILGGSAWRRIRLSSRFEPG